jgi:putative DNA primase/helicase
MAIKTKTNEKLEAALFYANQGWKVFPLHSVKPNGSCSCHKGANCDRKGKHPKWHEELLPNGLKDATDDIDLIRQWWSLWPDANIGIATGATSGIIVIDGDGEEGKRSIKELIQEHGELPQTAMQKTGSGGLHILFKHPGWFVQNSVKKLAPGIDVRGDGGYIVVPPSNHVSGHNYQWIYHPKDAGMADVPKWLADMLQTGNEIYLSKAHQERKGRVWRKYVKGEVIPDGERNETLFRRVASSMRAKGAGYEDILATLLEINSKRVKPPLEESEVIRIADSVLRYPPGTAQPTALSLLAYPDTDYGNAERLVARHGIDLKYCIEMDSWLVWDGTRWVKDEKYEVYRRAMETIRAFRDEAQTELEKLKEEYKEQSNEELSKKEQAERKEKLDNAEKRVRFARQSEFKSRIEAMITLAKTLAGIPVGINELDQDPYKLNLLNGTVDLKSGQVYPHSREDLITKICPVEYNQHATAPTWNRFLNDIFAGDQELIEYVQKAIGYALTGDTREQAMFFLYGGGANGKSTFLNTIKDMVGDYGQQAPTSLLMAKQNEGVPNDVARLPGARFVTTIETEDGKRMAESLVKQLTGGDTITARFLRQEFFEFKPVAKIFLCSNHKPLIRGTDYAIWRRIHLIPFEVQFPKEKRDETLPEKLRGEMAGILRWALEGCQKWQREGLTPPEKVVKATDEYKAEMDALGQFITDCCTIAEGAKVQVRRLYQAYTEWCEETGEYPMNNRMFGKRLKERGFTQAKSTGGYMYWFGIGFSDEYVTNHIYPNISQEWSTPKERAETGKLVARRPWEGVL